MTSMRITVTMTTITHTHNGQKAKAEKQEGRANNKGASLQSIITVIGWLDSRG
jgi:hypothetical protein